MAIISGFARQARVDEMANCPLSAHAAGGDEASCADCAYNALNPGHARVGCVLSTPAAVYDRCMSHLKAISSNDYGELQKLLKAGRETGTAVGVSGAEVERLRRIAEKWWPLVGNDPAEQQVVTAILRFCDASLARHEPIKILA
jgi:hypothetical protein